MKNFEYLILGLGNIGEKYAKTRHNIGWMIAERFAAQRNIDLSSEKMNAYMGEGKYASKGIVVALPTTYMNLSGVAAKKILNQYEIPAQNLIAIVDEYNFPVGKLHLRSGGSDGGHNGLTSLIEELGTADFMRLRCGIDKKFGPGELVNYVLGEFPKEEEMAVEQMIQDGVKAIEHIIKIGKQRAMSDINSAKIFASKEVKADEPNIAKS